MQQPIRWPDSLCNGTEMGRRIREFDWSQTSLGPIEQWPLELRTSVTLLATDSVAMALLWGDDYVAFYNDRYVPIAGDKHPGMLGTPVSAVWPEIWDAVEPLLAGARSSGKPFSLENQRFDVWRHGFLEEIYVTAFCAPLRMENVEGGIFIIETETTKHVLADRRMQALSRLSARLRSTQNESATYEELRNGLREVPDLPFAFVYLRDETAKSTANLAVAVATAPTAHEPDSQIDLSRDLSDYFGSSAVIVPLRFSEERNDFGVFVAGTNPRVPLDGDYRDYLSLLAAHIAGAFAEVRALQNAQAYERELQIAHAFQNAALPRALPTIPGLRFSALYEPAGLEANVGGDFYDAFRLLDGRVVVAVGDVSGAGLDAATTMGALRQSLRAAASINPDPQMLLKAADGIFAEAGRAPFASAFVAVIDPLTLSMRYANAGHPPPVLRSPGGTPTLLESNDLLLGVTIADVDISRRTGQMVIEPKSLLVLYTDGLSEATRDPIEGEQRLREAVSTLDLDGQHAGSAAKTICRTVLDGRAVHDDVALLTVYFERSLTESQDRLVRWQFSSDDGEAAHRIRAEFERTLRAGGMNGEEIFAAEMIFAELLGNVVRHAGTQVDVLLDCTNEIPVLHVLDSGEGFSLNPKLPTDAYSECGRGLYIVKRLARDLTVTPRTNSRGSHARAVLTGRFRTSSASGPMPVYPVSSANGAGTKSAGT